MSKTIEEIKNEYAKELGYSSWINIGYNADSEKRNNEVAQRYAQSQTQEIKDQNAELVMTLETIASLITSQTSMYTVKASLLQILTKHNHLNKK